MVKIVKFRTQFLVIVAQLYNYIALASTNVHVFRYFLHEIFIIVISDHTHRENKNNILICVYNITQLFDAATWLQ